MFTSGRIENCSKRINSIKIPIIVISYRFTPHNNKGFIKTLKIRIKVASLFITGGAKGVGPPPLIRIS